nr:hypothetical protein [Tanacetum cinerariifolium]
MEEYIKIEEEKAHRRGKVYNWEAATYGKIWCDEDVHELEYVETEFPAIVFNDTLTYEVALSCEPSVDFETSLSKCDGEEQTVIFFNDLFSFNVIDPDDLKSDKENDNENIDMKQPLGSLSIEPLPN